MNRITAIIFDKTPVPEGFAGVRLWYNGELFFFRDGLPYRQAGVIFLA